MRPPSGEPDSVLAEAERLGHRFIDAARPFVPNEVLERVLGPLSAGWDGAVPALPVADTLKRVDGEATVTETVDRRVA